MSGHERTGVMRNAVSLINKPSILYRGPEQGMSPEEGFDCSGFVSYVLKSAGIHVPDFIGMDNTPRPIRHASEYWDHYGIHVDAEHAKMGDLVFFSRTGMFPTHVGILTVHDTYIHAPGKDDTFVEEAYLDEYVIDRGDRTDRQLYTKNPIGFKALTTVAANPTARYHQKLVD